MAAGASSFAGFSVDPRGPDTTAFNWALAVFKARISPAGVFGSKAPLRLAAQKSRPHAPLAL
jgi:hypothetical protein